MGASTFGGGYAVIPVAERELVKKKGWLTIEEVLDYYTIAQITPGIISVNLATFVGNKQAGTLGGIFATLGFVLPGISLVMAAALLISNFAELPIVQHAFAGIRIAVAALILDTVIKMIKGAFKDAKAVAIYITVLAISLVPLGIFPPEVRALLKSPVFLVLASGALALVIYRKKPRGAKEGQ